MSVSDRWQPQFSACSGTNLARHLDANYYRFQMACRTKGAYMHSGDSGGFPGPLFIFSRQRPRRPYTSSDLRIVALIVGLGVVAALLWLAIALH
jgi:hypothetical protein